VNRSITSIPGGAIDKGETPLQGAKRELREEAGLVAKYWKPMFTMYQDPGRSTAKKWLFLARDVRPIQSTRDRSERTTRLVVPFQRLVHDVLQGKHHEPTLIAAVLWHFMNDRKALEKIQSHEGMRKLKDY
jgi:ADP-ribose pyrophosphatase